MCGTNTHTLSLDKQALIGTSLAVQWLRLCLPMQGVRVQSLVGELRSHRPRGQKNQNIKKQKQYCDKFNKDFKKIFKKKSTYQVSTTRCQACIVDTVPKGTASGCLNSHLRSLFASYIASGSVFLSPNFFICTMRILIIPTSWEFCEY